MKQKPRLAPITQYEVCDLPRLGWIRIEEQGEENTYFRLSDGSLGFIKI